MALKISGAKTLAVLLATAAVAAISLGAPEASAQPRKRNVEGSQTYDGPPRKPRELLLQVRPNPRVHHAAVRGSMPGPRWCPVNASSPITPSAGLQLRQAHRSAVHEPPSGRRPVGHRHSDAVPAVLISSTQISKQNARLAPGIFVSTGQLNRRLRGERIKLADDGLAHLRGADHFRAFGLDVAGAQALGQRRGDRLIDEIGFLCMSNE